jgi:prepilin-type N-terminal cleavage/methylation domain-containing protein
MVTKNNKGWTLVELTITAAVIGIVAMLAPQIISQSTKVFVLGRTKLELQREARAAMYLITRELRQAQSNTIVIDQINGQPYYSRISFTKIQNANVTIAQSGSSLQLTIGNDITTLSKNLAYLAFTFPHSDDMTIVSVSLTLQQQIYNGLFKALHMASERVRVMD